MLSRKSYAIAGAVVAGIFASPGRAYRRFQRELSDSRSRVRRGSALAATACGPIEYAQQGLGEPMLVVHGAGGGFDQGVLFGRGLAQRGFLVTAMSRFGYLNTPLPQDASPQAQADAHANLLHALRIPETIVVGVSAGAPSALQFALRHPQRCSGLVLLVPMTWAPGDALRSVHRPARLAQWMLRWLIGSDLFYWTGLRFARNLVIKTVLGTPPSLVKFADERERARIDEVLRTILPLSSRAAGLDNDARVAASLGRYDLENVRVPTLIIALRDDLYGMFAGARYTAQQIPGAKLVTFDEGGHLWVGHQDEVMDAIASFARECTRALPAEARDGR